MFSSEKYDTQQGRHLVIACRGCVNAGLGAGPSTTGNTGARLLHMKP